MKNDIDCILNRASYICIFIQCENQVIDDTTELICK